MADEIVFTNPEVQAAYKALITVDKQIERPGTYKGKLSGITPEMAKGMVERGSNLIAKKESSEIESLAPDLKPAKEVIDLISQATTVDAVNELTTGDTRQSVVKARDKKIGELTG